MALLLRLALSLFLAAAAATSAHAERRIALVIGNGAYSGVSPLTNPKNDADLMAKTLTSVGFEVTKLVDADQRTMKQAMLDFGRKLRDGTDASLFYYSGHGVQAKGENYLIPVDASIKDEGELDLQAIDVNAFLQVMDNASSKVNIVILDACHNNPFASSLRSASRGLAMVDAPRGTYIAYSTGPGDVAEDGSGENSPYTEALAKAMIKPGVKLEDAFKNARRLVLAATDNKQVPWETTSITGDFYFIRKPAKPPAPPASTPDASAEANPAAPPSEPRKAPSIVLPALAGTYEVNRNRRGMDYKNFLLTAPDPRLCQQACQSDDQCRAWTFVNPGKQGANARCWLKNGVPVSTPGNCCTSGVKPAASLAPDQSSAEADCFAFVQGSIPWSDSGGVTSWSPTNIQSLCQGTTKAAEPGRCFDRIMHSGVNWGGGTKWEWPNALNLCKGTSSADATVSCFQAKIAGGARWPQAIAQCKSPVAPLISARPNPTN